MAVRGAKRQQKIVVALAVSAVLHAIFVFVALHVQFGLAGPASSVSASASGDGATNIDPACLAQEGLTALARASLCLPPSFADRDACLARVAERFELARLGCVNVETPIDLAMVSLVPEPPPVDILEEAQKAVDELEAAQLQTVEIAPPRVELEPEKAEHSGEFNNRVGKETVRKGTPQPAVVVGPAESQQPSPVAPKNDGKSSSPAASGGNPGRVGALDIRGAARENSARGGGQVAGDTPGAPGTPDGREAGEGGDSPRKGLGVALDTQPGEGGGGGDLGDGSPHKGPPNVRPGQDVLARAASGTYDALEDIDEGEETLINTKRFKYASFFNRVKRAVWENWHADRAYALRDPDGKIYGVKDRQTVLKVTLRPDGSLAHVMVESPCGVDFLDDEAVNAFKKAQPFPNPPAGLIDSESKLITFRFGFLLDIQDKPSWRIVRYQ